MKLLLVGDVVGQPGRRVLLNHINHLRRNHEIELVIANIENAAGGFGITEKIAKQLLSGGIDVLSSGNHIWDKKEVLAFISQEQRLLRPHNYPEPTPGSGWAIVPIKENLKVGVLNILGTVFIHPALDCPFRCVDKVLEKKPEDVSIVVLDFHAEATSEKMAMGWYVDGRVSAMLGTHTHVPTADECILPKGTAYISDVGMTGCYHSVVGMNKTKVINRFLNKIPERSEVAEGPASLCGVLVDIDEQSGRSRNIQRIRIDE